MNHLFEEFKKEVERIEFPEARLEKAIQKVINDGKPKRSVGKKIAFLSSAAALFICLLFGSAFVSPTMAATLSKIPVIGSVFELGDPGEDIRDELRDKGYKIKDVFVSEPEKVVGVWVGGSEAYFTDVKGDVKTIAENVLKSKQYDAFTVKVTDMRDVVSDMREDVDISEHTQRFIAALPLIEAALEENGYDADTAGVLYGDDKKTLEVWINGSEEYYNSVKDDVKNTVTSVIQETNFHYEQLEVTRRSSPPIEFVSLEESPWFKSGVLEVISSELLGKKGYHVKGIEESMDNGSMQWNITISLKSTDPSARRIEQGIKENIITILESKRFKPTIDGRPYEINVYGEDKKIIN